MSSDQNTDGKVIEQQQQQNSHDHEEENQEIQPEIVESSQEMAMHIGLPPPEPLNLSEGNVSENWKKFKQKYTNYEIATGISAKGDATRVATLLTVIGNDAIDVFNTLTWDAEGDDKKIDKVIQKLEQHCEPKKNVSYERYKFNSRSQESGETIDQYVTILRKLSESCEFGTLKDSLIKDRIVLGVNNQKTRERLLRVPDLTLGKALDVVRSAEVTEQQMREIDSDTSVHGVGRGRSKQQEPKEVTNSNQAIETNYSRKFNCGNCGTRHAIRECPAYGKKCHNCQRLNHFQKMCRSRKVQVIQHQKEDAKSLFVGSINTHIQNEECFVTLPIQGHLTKLKIDTGAQVNILPLCKLKEIAGEKPHMEPCHHRLVSYSEDNLKVLGTATLPVQSKSKAIHNLTFHIIETHQPGLLGLTASQELGLIKVVMTTQANKEHSEEKKRPHTSTEDLKDEVIKKYPSVFTGLGRLNKPYCIEIDPKAKPVVNPARSVPAALRDKVKTELEDMERLGVIRKVDGPTDWVNSMAIVEKPDGTLRICLDPKHLNDAIRREYFQLPTIEDITTRMADAQLFTKLDANKGYWQIPLEEESQLLTTFGTPFGRYCYQVVPFGISSAQEVFQKRMSQHFGDLQGVETDIDDIIIHAENEDQHDDRLYAVLERCKNINLTLNRKKCSFKTEEVTYLGHKLTKEGVKPDDEKIRAVQDMPAPVDKKGVERLLGTINYLGKFIPNLATITEPIRALLRKDTEFQWSHEHDKALQQLKNILTSDGGPVLKFFDVQKPVTVSCDASPSGLGGVLLQDEVPVAYASRSLTDAESRYAQIEKELLAVQFSLERFNQYTYGKRVTVRSDHKPLEAIVKKPLASASPRLQRILLRLQKYDYHLEYTPGKEQALPDLLSRAPLPETANDIEEEIAAHVHMITSSLPASLSKLEELKKATEEDLSLRDLKQQIKSGWPETKEETSTSVHAYWNIRDELSEIDGIILRGHRIVVPSTMRKEMLDRIHQGHMGIEKSKNRARDALYWPGMNAQIQDLVSQCSICQENQRQNTKEPMIPTNLPSKPWEKLATDLFTWDNDEYLIIVDYHSRFFEVAKLANTKAATVITHSKSIFARHGIPSEIISDNGPQYSSKEYQIFAQQWEFKHTTVSPLNPQANGLAERTVQTIKSLLTKAKKDKRDPYLALLEYRNTPVDGVASPAQLLMSRRLRSIIPSTNAQLQPQVVDPNLIQEKQSQRQERQKHYYDQHAKPLPSLAQGERIRVKIGKQWKPGTVEHTAETPRSYWIKTDEGREYRRNRKMLRKSSEEEPSTLDDEEHASEMEGSSHSQEISGGSDTEDSFTPLKGNGTAEINPATTEAASPIRTRSGRITRKPTRFRDFVMYT